MNETKTKKTQLKDIDNQKDWDKATSGNYRACVKKDHCIFQIGEDTPDIMLAFKHSNEYKTDTDEVQIFDEKGNCYILDNKLQIHGEHQLVDNNSFLTNAKTYFYKIMKQKYVEKSEILSLKTMFKRITEKENPEIYKPILNKITRIANKAIGKNDPTILRDVYNEFILLYKQ